MTNAEIQVGEYIRTYGGYLKKIISIIKKENGLVYKTDNHQFVDYITKEYIKAHSFNLIDLIEAGDYVNGIEVEVIGYDNNENGELVETLGVAYVDDDVAWRTELKDISHIYTIVTKEQFKSMEYEVAEDD